MINQTDKQEEDFLKAEKFRSFIEKEVLKIFKKLIENKLVSREKIQEMAQVSLKLIKPGMTLEELYRNAVKLDDRHPELAPVVFLIMKEYEERYEKKALDQVRQLVRSGNYEEATDIVKKILEFKVLN